MLAAAAIPTQAPQGIGRVSGVGPGCGAPPPFSLYSDTLGTHDAHAPSTSAGALATDSLQPSMRVDESDVAIVFFGADNVDALQHGIRYGVFRDTDGAHIIGRQSDVELALIMRSIYLQGSRNVDGDRATVLAQVRALNAEVLDYTIPRILQEVNMYAHYRRDVSSLPAPLPRGEIATTKGDRSLEMKPPIF